MSKPTKSVLLYLAFFIIGVFFPSQNFGHLIMGAAFGVVLEKFYFAALKLERMKK